MLLDVYLTGSASRPLFDATEQTFTVAANYTVFLVGSPAAPGCIVRKDR